MKIVGFAIGMAGIALLVYSVGVLPAVAVFLMMWGDNLTRSEP